MKINKIRIYRALGWFFVVLGVVKFSLFFILLPQKFQRFISNPSQEFFPAFYGSLMLFCVQYFLWVGLILQWRADRNEGIKDSKWGYFLLCYVLLTAGMVLFTVLMTLSVRYRS